MILGYARASTVEQAASVEQQMERLKAAGAEKVWSDLGVSGGTMFRGEFQKMLEQARAGDVLLVTKLDRFGRTVRGIVELVDELTTKGIALRTLDGIDTSDENPSSRFFLQIMASFAELERSMTRLRTKEAAAARRDPKTGRMRGNQGGRPAVVKSQGQADAIRKLYESGMTAKAIAEMHRVSESSVRRSLRKTAAAAAEAMSH